jgi:hypothetical protein
MNWAQYINKVVEPQFSPFSEMRVEKKLETSVAGSGCSGCEECSGDGDNCGAGIKLFVSDYAGSSCDGCGHCSDGQCSGCGPSSCEMDD